MGILSDGEAESIRMGLERERFVVASSVSSQFFGDVQTVWQRGGLLIRLTKDRGQWFGDVARDGWDDWFDVDDVAAVVPAVTGDRSLLVPELVQAMRDDGSLVALRDHRDRRRRQP